MSLNFIIDQNILDGYPHLETLGNFPNTQIAPYPNMFQKCNQSYLDGYPSFNKNFPNTQILPYPRSMMFVDNKYLDEYPSFGENFPSTQIHPYPKSMMLVDNKYLNGYPSFGKLFISFGAFKNTKSLISIQIPSSVKEIGDFSFTGTSLLNVTISRDCKYNVDTTFPEDCMISFY